MSYGAFAIHYVVTTTERRLWGSLTIIQLDIHSQVFEFDPERYVSRMDSLIFADGFFVFMLFSSFREQTSGSHANLEFVRLGVRLGEIPPKRCIYGVVLKLVESEVLDQMVLF